MHTNVSKLSRWGRMEEGRLTFQASWTSFIRSRCSIVGSDFLSSASLACGVDGGEGVRRRQSASWQRLATTRPFQKGGECTHGHEGVVLGRLSLLGCAVSGEADRSATATATVGGGQGVPPGGRQGDTTLTQASAVRPTSLQTRGRSDNACQPQPMGGTDHIHSLPAGRHDLRGFGSGRRGRGWSGVGGGETYSWTCCVSWSSRCAFWWVWEGEIGVGRAGETV